MAFIVRTPQPPLSALVSSIWLADQYVPGPHSQEQVLPTGTCALIVNLRNGAAALAGPSSKARKIETAAQLLLVGVDFRPGGAFPFFPVPLNDLTNGYAALEDLWGPLASEFCDAVLEARTPATRLDLVERVLGSRLAAMRTLHPAVTYAVGHFGRHPRSARVEEVVRQIGMSHRRFLDLFAQQVGLTPKLFCRVRRFQRLLKRIHCGPFVDWADLAVECGYYDQAHLVNEVQGFAGVSPTEYLGAVGRHLNHIPLTD